MMNMSGVRAARFAGELAALISVSGASATMMHMIYIKRENGRLTMSKPICTYCGDSEWFVDGRSIYCRRCKCEQASNASEQVCGDYIAFGMVAIGFIGWLWWLI